MFSKRSERPAPPDATPRAERRRRDLATRLRDDKGYVAAMTALLLVPLMAFTAFAVDAGSWFAQGAEQQRTADAAALAGVVYMPNLGRATSTAKEVAKKNGYEDGVNATVTVVPTASNRIKVKIEAKGDIFFGGVMGHDDQDLNRSATAEFLLTIPMGSPLNFSGIDPEIANATSGLGNNPSFFNQSAGYTTSKVSGDRYTAGDGGGAAFQASCTGPPTNCDYNENGYIYLTKVAALGSGPLDIQVYDPAAVGVGDFCDGAANASGNTLATTAQVTALQAQYNGLASGHNGKTFTNADIAERWGRLDQAPNNAAAELPKAKRFCSGDWLGTWSAAAGAVNPKTTWIVRAPDNTPLDYLDNPPICAITFDSYSGLVFDKLSVTKNADWDKGLTSTEKVPFYKHFHNWFSICNVASPQVGSYVIQVRNNANTSNLGATPQTTATSGLNVGTLAAAGVTTNGNLHNRYSLRAGWSGSTPAAALQNSATPGVAPVPITPAPAWAANISVYAESRFPIYTNQGNAKTTFYLSRVTPEYKGSRIRLNLYDIGDGADVNLSIRPPTDATAGALKTCTWARDNNPAGFTFTKDGSVQCGVLGLNSSNFNGHLTSATIDIAPNYSCDSGSANGCWFLIDITPVSGNPNDTTTWSAEVLGNPLHLVE